MSAAGELDARGAVATPAAEPRRAYLTLLGWAFAAFNSARVVAYVPTLWAIVASGDSNQHSLWTWVTFFGANATMAASLREQRGERSSRAAAVCAVNAAMCLAITVTILWFRR